MREKFPEKEPGEHLSAGHLNRLSSVARRFSKAKSSGWGGSFQGESVVSDFEHNPHAQFVMEVSNAETDEDGLYRGKILYYSEADSDWVANDEEWPLDADAVGIEVAESDLVVAFWQIRRTAFIPMSAGGSDRKFVRFTLTEALTATDEVKQAVITNQYGPGTAATNLAINVYNMLTHNLNTYLFEGDSGDAGLAHWDEGQEYIIHQMECP